ncbi:MAG: glycoside hydrolase family 73 protein [Bacteroidota bacterium]
MKNSSRHPAARWIITAVLCVVSFACGRFVFPLGAESGERKAESGTSLVDSLIGEWTSARQLTVWDAAGMTQDAGDARVGYFSEQVRQLAARSDSMYGVPAPVTLAQYALESRFGTLHLRANNFFGHKFRVTELYGPRPPVFVYGFTKEFQNGGWVTVKEKFARYASISECFDTHGRFLSTSPLYSKSLSYRKDPKRYAREIGKRYATDPDYALKLITIMKRYDLARRPA